MNYRIRLVENKDEGEKTKPFIVTKKQYDLIEKKATKQNSIEYLIELIEKTENKMEYSDLMVWSSFLS